MAEDAAFFRFDSNADAVASDIAGAMARINSAVSKPLDSNALSRTTDSLGGVFKGMDAELGKARAEVNSLLSRAASGAIDPKAFKGEFERVVRGAVRTIPTTMANELGSASNQTAAGRAPIRAIATELGQDYVKTLTDTVRAGRGALGDAFKGQKLLASNAFATDIASVAMKPANFGQESSQIQTLRNQLRAEEFLRKDPVLANRSNDLQAANDAGFSTEYMRQVQAQSTQVTDKGRKFTGSGAAAEIASLKLEEEAVRKADVAWQKLTDTLLKNDLADKQRAAAEAQRGQRSAAAAEKVRNAEEIARQREQAKYAANNAGFTGGAVNRFSRGGVSPLTNLGTQVASAASFSIGYGALFGGLGAAKDTLSEFLDYQDSLTDLEVATRDTSVVTNEFVDDLSEMSRMVGENLGSSLDTAARGIRAFGDPLNDTNDELVQIGLNANEAANKLALVAGKSLKDATGDTVAVGTAYGLKPDQLTQITDAVANAKKLGADAGQISQGLASISTSAESAGYNVDQAAALVSLVQSRTDESGQAVSTRLTKIFQVVAGSTGKRLGAEFDVDTDQSVRKQLEDYAEIYSDPNTSKAKKDRISSSLGGTANLKELLPVLQEGKRLQDAYAEAAENAGQGTQEFERKSGNLVGTLKKIQGDVKNIQVDLARTGLLDPFGALLITLEPMLQLLDRALKLFNELPGPIKQTAAVLIDLAIASKLVALVGAARATSKLASGAAIAAETVAAAGPATIRTAAGAAPTAITGINTALLTAQQAQLAGTATITQQRLLVESNLNRTVASTTLARKGAETAAASSTLAGAKAIGGTLIKSSTLITGALLGVAYLANKLITGEGQRKDFQRTYSGTSNAFGRVDGTSASLSAAAKDLGAAAGEIDKSKSNFVSERLQGDLVDSLKGQQAGLTVLARRVNREEKANAVESPLDVFGDNGVITGVDELSSGLSRLSDSGYTATQRMKILNDVLNNTATADTAEKYQPEAFSSEIAATSLDFLNDAIPKTVTVLKNARDIKGGGRFASESGVSPQDTEVVSSNLLPGIRNDPRNSAEAIDAVVRNKAKELGLSKGDILTPEQKTVLAKAAADAFNLDALGKDAGEVRQQILDELLKSQGLGFDLFTGGGAEQRNGTFPFRTPKALQAGPQLNGTGGLNEGQLKLIFDAAPDGSYQSLVEQQQADLQAIPSSDDGTKTRATLKRNAEMLRNLKTRAAKKGVNYGALNLALDNAEDAYATSMVDRINELRRVAQNKAAGDPKKIRAIGLASLKDAIKTAGANPRLLGEIMADANQSTLAIVRASLVSAERVAEKARVLQQQMAVLAAQLVADAANIFGGDAEPARPEKVPETAARRRRRAFDQAISGANVEKTGGVYATGSDAAEAAAAEADRKSKADKADDDRTAAQKAAQAAGARLNPDDTVGQARNDLQSAKADLDAAKEGSEEYYSAMQSVAEARNSLGDAIRSRSAAIAQSLIDPDDTIRSAVVSLQIARTNLAGASSGTEEYYTALGEVTQAQDALAKAQADKVGAIAGARAARVGGGIASSRSELISATATMRSTAKGTAGWFQALGSFYNAQRSMRDAILAFKANKDQLRGDITDPVENARDALREARRKLAQDRRTGQGRDVIAEDRVGERNAENALQASKFEQRFSDAQTAESLGRISFAKYMNYLDHEHERLSKIKNRTRQQQDQLDQVDGAMKSALDSMDSQFNLGDINTNGLVYQTRRFAAEARAGAAASQVSSASTQTQNVRIDINGADTAKVKSILDTYLRIEGGQRQSLTRRKV